MTGSAMSITHLHCGATYTAAKAKALADALNMQERADDTNYTDGAFTGFEYRADIKGLYGRVAAFDESGEFVGYF